MSGRHKGQQQGVDATCGARRVILESNSKSNLIDSTTDMITLKEEVTVSHEHVLTEMNATSGKRKANAFPKQWPIASTRRLQARTPSDTQYSDCAPNGTLSVGKRKRPQGSTSHGGQGDGSHTGKKSGPESKRNRLTKDETGASGTAVRAGPHETRSTVTKKLHKDGNAMPADSDEQEEEEESEDTCKDEGDETDNKDNEDDEYSGEEDTQDKGDDEPMDTHDEKTENIGEEEEEEEDSGDEDERDRQDERDDDISDTQYDEANNIDEADGNNNNNDNKDERDGKEEEEETGSDKEDEGDDDVRVTQSDQIDNLGDDNNDDDDDDDDDDYDDNNNTRNNDDEDVEEEDSGDEDERDRRGEEEDEEEEEEEDEITDIQCEKDKDIGEDDAVGEDDAEGSYVSDNKHPQRRSSRISRKGGAKYKGRGRAKDTDGGSIRNKSHRRQRGTVTEEKIAKMAELRQQGLSNIAIGRECCLHQDTVGRRLKRPEAKRSGEIARSYLRHLAGVSLTASTKPCFSLLHSELGRLCVDDVPSEKTLRRQYKALSTPTEKKDLKSTKQDLRSSSPSIPTPQEFRQHINTYAGSAAHEPIDLSQIPEDVYRYLYGYWFRGTNEEEKRFIATQMAAWDVCIEFRKTLARKFATEGKEMIDCFSFWYDYWFGKEEGANTNGQANHISVAGEMAAWHVLQRYPELGHRSPSPEMGQSLRRTVDQMIVRFGHRYKHWCQRDVPDERNRFIANQMAAWYVQKKFRERCNGNEWFDSFGDLRPAREKYAERRAITRGMRAWYQSVLQNSVEAPADLPASGGIRIKIPTY